jgi:DHA1 family multidrug resistance protein-like MFS transporter
VELHPLYITWIMFAVANVSTQAVFALFVAKNFGFDAFATGLTFTAIGIVVAINQTVLLKRLWLKRFNDAALEKMMLWFLIVGLLLFVTKSIYLFALSVLLNGTGQSVLRVVLTSQVAGAADPQSKGEKLGILSSFTAASMVIGPIVAGILFEVHDTLPYVAAATCLAFGLIIADRYQRNRALNSDQAIPREAQNTE